MAAHTHRKYLFLLAVAVFACSLAAWSTDALAGSTFTWSGDDASSPNWSVADNWAGTAPSAIDSGDSLIFPANLSGGDCATTQTDQCYTAEDNLSGYSISSLQIDDGDGYYLRPDNAHDPLTIGVGGITATTSSTSFNPGEFGLPIALGAPQLWFVSGGASGLGQLTFDGGLSGSSTLGIHVSDQGYVDVDGASDSEVGNVTMTGASSADSGTAAAGNGALEIDGSKLNATNGNSVTLDTATIFGSGTVGNLISDGGQVEPGYPTGRIAVNGNVNFNRNSSLGDSAFTPLIIDAGTTPATDYSQLTATGTVTLGFANLDIEAGNDTNSCPTLNFGAVYTLISAHTIVGYLGSPGGSFGATMNCVGANAPVFSIAYNTTASPQTVTATVVGPGATTGTNVYVNNQPYTGQPVSLEANVQAGAPVTDAPVTPVGTVEFESNGAPIAGCASQPLILDQTPASKSWNAACTTTASQIAGPYSYQARFNPTDTQTGGQLPSISTAQTGQVAAFVPDGGTATLTNATTNGIVATLALGCDGVAGQSCTDVNATLSVHEVIKDGKVVAVTAAAKPKSTKRKVVVGSLATTLEVHTPTTVDLQLNRAGQALLKAHHRLQVGLSITSHGSVLYTRTLTFIEPAPPKRKH